MNKTHLTVCLVILSVLTISCSKKPLNVPDQNFNKGWLFKKAETDATEATFDDSDWEAVTLPHDWAIFGPFSDEHNARTGGLPVDGMGWYRKHFQVGSELKGKTVSIEFDGAMNDAYVWVNGTLVGNRPFGYIGFEFDITPQIRFGEENIIAVRLNPKDLSSRWYPGAGIYRNVRIKYNEPTHIAQWGTYITTPTVTDQEATLLVVSTINNSGAPVGIQLESTVLDKNGKPVATATQDLQLAEKASTPSTVGLTIPNPERWDIENPYLYQLVSQVIVDGQVIDKYVSTFGVRSLEITSEEGLKLNGKQVRLDGVCLHHDLGPLGAAVNYRALERQVQLMQSMGVNSIRTSHNPPASELLDICDKLGVLVIVEAFDEWKIGKVANGYNNFFDEWHEKDLRDMIKRDRNHPSVIMWSIGNEILEQGRPDGWKVAKKLADICRDEDPTRMVTAGFNYYPAPFKHKLAYQVDVVGMNYKPLQYIDVKEANPDMIIYGSETSSQTSSRGVYHLPIEADVRKETGQASSYDVIVGPPWAYPPDVEFAQQEKHPFLLGEYMWTGIDYLGEPTPYGGRDNSTNGYWNDDWPSRSSYFAPVDLAGIPKDRFYLYQSQWTEEPMVHLLPHWNWEGMEGKNIPVYVYTNGEEAELFLNGKSLGKKVKGKDLTPLPAEFRGFPKGIYESPYRLSWEVPYQPGALKVVAYHQGQAIAEKAVQTAEAPSNLKLEADRDTLSASGVDLSYITVSVVDEKGTLCPRAEHAVTFSIEGEGFIAGVCNGDPRSLTPMKGNKMEAFSGKLVVVVQSTETSGAITLTAKAEGLETSQLVLTTKAENQ